MKHTVNRRAFLARSSKAMAGLLVSALSVRGTPVVRHHEPRARSVIFLYMQGGPSQVDTFDPKPELSRLNGRPFPMQALPTQNGQQGKVLASPFRFQRHGESGIPVSSLFPYLAEHVDDLAVIRSMTSDCSEHGTAVSLLHVGRRERGAPSLGAWVCHALADDRRELPAFVVLSGNTAVHGGGNFFGAGVLPPDCQGSVLRPQAPPLANLKPHESEARQRRKLDVIERLDHHAQANYGSTPDIEAAMASQQLAYWMQQSIPQAMDLSGESPATRVLYGMDDEFPLTQTYARQCLSARRLVERGVRFIELTNPDTHPEGWDQHDRLRAGHAKAARAVDRPIAGLLYDLKQRGLLDSTLVVWAGEFGRTPFSQGTKNRDGRDHNPFGFTIWMAGGGVGRGIIHGATDEFGYRAIQDRANVHDLHATILHLLGIDHTRLTVRHAGRDVRLTDVYGRVMDRILA